MATVYSGNIVLGQDNRRLFNIGGNLVPRFKIGDERLGYWLVGQLVGPHLEPLFNGRLYLPTGEGGGIIIDNFPKADAPTGWTRHQIAGNGYDLKNDARQVLFGYQLAGNLCRVITNIYNDKGEAVATATDEGLVVNKGPAAIL